MLSSLTSYNEHRFSTKWLTIYSSSQSTWAVSPPLDPSSPFINQSFNQSVKQPTSQSLPVFNAMQPINRSRERSRRWNCWSTQLIHFSQKNPLCSFLKFFPKRLGIFNHFFTHLLYVQIYVRLQIFIQLAPILTKLCHTKQDHPSNFWHFTRT